MKWNYRELSFKRNYKWIWKLSKMCSGNNVSRRRGGGIQRKVKYFSCRMNKKLKIKDFVQSHTLRVILHEVWRLFQFEWQNHNNIRKKYLGKICKDQGSKYVLQGNRITFWFLFWNNFNFEIFSFHISTDIKIIIIKL